MAHDITPNAPHAIITVKLALNTLCGDTAADGLNDLLNPEIGAGFIADYALLHTDNPMIVHASEEPEEGELFVESATWLVMTKRDGSVTGYHRVESTLPLHLLAQDALATLMSGKFVIEPGECLEVLKIDEMKRHFV